MQSSRRTQNRQLQFLLPLRDLLRLSTQARARLCFRSEKRSTSRVQTATTLPKVDSLKQWPAPMQQPVRKSRMSLWKRRCRSLRSYRRACASGEAKAIDSLRNSGQKLPTLYAPLCRRYPMAIAPRQLDGSGAPESSAVKPESVPVGAEPALQDVPFSTYIVSLPVSISSVHSDEEVLLSLSTTIACPAPSPAKLPVEPSLSAAPSQASASRYPSAACSLRLCAR